MVNIYVSNLSFKIDEEFLKSIFENYGQVQFCKIIRDKFTGKSRGFGFVEMTNDEEGQKAIDALNETEHDGRKIMVNVAKPREESREGNSRGGGRGRDRDRRNSDDRW